MTTLEARHLTHRFAIIATAVWASGSTAHAIRVCDQPIFSRQMEIEGRLYSGRDPKEAIRLAKELNEMLARSCRDVKARPRETGRKGGVHIGDNCFQKTGVLHGRTVYWLDCHE